MDILHLVDRLEELFNNSKPVPFMRAVGVDEGAFMDIIDQMRISIPEEVKKAQQIIAQKDRILAQAQEEANRTVAIAREKGEKLVENSDIYQKAQLKAESLLKQAEMEAEQYQLDAEQYVSETLSGLHNEIKQILIQVENGIEALQPKE
jgi:hypothetical protein